MTKLDENKDTSEAKVEDEIEITPAMIEAGVSGLYRFNRERDIAEDAVASIFLEMWRARVNPGYSR